VEFEATCVKQGRQKGHFATGQEGTSETKDGREKQKSDRNHPKTTRGEKDEQDVLPIDHTGGGTVDGLGPQSEAQVLIARLVGGKQN